MRRSLAALAGGLAIVAAGCGGGGGGGGNASLPEAASVVPASAPVLITINTDFTSEQWQKVATLFDKFPDGNLLLAQVQKELKGVRLADYETALGPVLDSIC